MARMTSEFSLVLVGSGILTAGYFLYPDDELEAKQKEAVQQQVAGNNNNNNNNLLGLGTGGGVVGVTNTGAPVIATSNTALGFGLDNRRRNDLVIVRAGLNWKFNGWIW